MVRMDYERPVRLGESIVQLPNQGELVQGVCFGGIATGSDRLRRFPTERPWL